MIKIFMPQENLEISADHLPARVWQELTRAPHDRHHDWRTPILATQGIDQIGPQARTVVLRYADASLWTLRVYTDARSAKCSEVLSQPLAQLTFWSKLLNWQLRVSALATVDFEGEEVNAAWERVRQSRAAADYLSVSPPGSPQSSGEFATENSGDSPHGHHLAILNFKVCSMDWLGLSKDGHRRARITPAGLLQWLVP
ncbi:MAG: pyridoxamine 5'-phosphate oxidase family protein [Burkholderiaceae bacterium]